MTARNELERQTSTGEPGYLRGKGSSVSATGPSKESMDHAAWSDKRALTTQLMERICERDNLNKAYKRVVSNDGAAGIDGMKVTDLKEWIKENKGRFIRQLLDGTYKPQPVRRVMIPKPGGGERCLGIPTVTDRLVQQAILQVLDPIVDPTFSEYSYGFRKNRGAHQALKQASQYVESGHPYVVDMDIEKFFDTINHDMMMSRLARYVGDKRLLKIVRGFLTSGMMVNGAFEDREQGTPQGGPLSPLLANILLDDLDKELERRGHKFCRYADDCNIYVGSQAAAQRVLGSMKRFIQDRLKLSLNENKSAASHVSRRTFLGYIIKGNGSMIASPESLKRLKGKLKQMTRRNRGRAIEGVVHELKVYLQGWISYFRLDGRTSVYQDIDSWLRRRLRCYRLRQRKRTHSIAQWLIMLGIEKVQAWRLAVSSKGWWRLSRTPQLHIALNNQWFSEIGLISIHKTRVRLNS